MKYLILFILSFELFAAEKVQLICKDQMSQYVKNNCKPVPITGQRAALLKSQYNLNLTCKKSSPVLVLLDSSCSISSEGQRASTAKEFDKRDLLNNRDLSHFPSSRTH